MVAGPSDLVSGFDSIAIVFWGGRELLQLALGPLPAP